MRYKGDCVRKKRKKVVQYENALTHTHAATVSSLLMQTHSACLLLAGQIFLYKNVCSLLASQKRGIGVVWGSQKHKNV